MKIAIISEIGNFSKYPRDFQNARTDVAWSIALNALNVPSSTKLIKDYIENTPSFKKLDLAIIIPGKKNPFLDVEFIKEHFAKKVCMMQEGPNWYWQDYDAEMQIDFYNALRTCDFLLCHNSSDYKYYNGITNLECLVMPSLMIEDTVNHLTSKKYEAEGIVTGGNFCSWYGGMDSFLTALSGRKSFSKSESKIPIFVPSMGRKIDNEDLIPDINHLPYMTWSSFIETLADKAKIGIHLMRTHAAGTFALNCSYLGIPCIGYRGLDTQEYLHPYTTVELGDVKAAGEMVRKLADPTFYNTCSEETLFLYKENYYEDVFKKRFINKLNNLVNEN